MYERDSSTAPLGYDTAFFIVCLTNCWVPFLMIDMYGDDQLYCIILLPYGGIDLEHCPLANWRQAWSILTQIASSLESKEQAPFWFEHRDLHWGNILVKGTRQDHILFPKRDLSRTSSSVAGTKDHDNEDQNDDNDGELFRKIPTCGIIVQMIDFTLARVQGGKRRITGKCRSKFLNLMPLSSNGHLYDLVGYLDKGNLIYMDLEKDQDLFRGQGDYQFDIYRMMRKQINKDWAASCPRTNLFVSRSPRLFVVPHLPHSPTTFSSAKYTKPGEFLPPSFPLCSGYITLPTSC